MSATDADPQSERALPREGQAWRLIRRILPVGRSIGSLAYLVSVGLTASWIIVVFFGASLFFLIPRSAKLATDSSPGGDHFDAFSAEIPWLIQSTSKLDRLSNLPPSERARPANEAALDKNGVVVAPGSRNIADVNERPMAADPTTAPMVDEAQSPTLSVPVSGGETAPASPPKSEPTAAARAPAAVQAPPSDTSRTRHNQHSRQIKRRHPMHRCKPSKTCCRSIPVCLNDGFREDRRLTRASARADTS
jgi:hypothetical protein